MREWLRKESGGCEAMRPPDPFSLVSVLVEVEVYVRQDPGAFEANSIESVRIEAERLEDRGRNLQGAHF